MKNVQSRVRERREKNVLSEVWLRRSKNVLSEVWLRRSEKRFKWSMATEKWKTFFCEVKLRRRRKPESSSWRTKRRIHFVLFLFSLSNNCVFVWLKLQDRAKIYSYTRKLGSLAQVAGKKHYQYIKLYKQNVYNISIFNYTKECLRERLQTLWNQCILGTTINRNKVGRERIFVE